MTLLDELRELNGTINTLTALKLSLIDRAVREGLKWQELAFIDKIEAIKLYNSKTPGCPSLETAKAVVESFLESTASSVTARQGVEGQEETKLQL